MRVNYAHVIRLRFSHRCETRIFRTQPNAIGGPIQLGGSGERCEEEAREEIKKGTLCTNRCESCQSYLHTTYELFLLHVKSCATIQICKACHQAFPAGHYLPPHSHEVMIPPARSPSQQRAAMEELPEDGDLPIYTV